MSTRRVLVAVVLMASGIVLMAGSPVFAAPAPAPGAPAAGGATFLDSSGAGAIGGGIGAGLVLIGGAAGIGRIG